MNPKSGGNEGRAPSLARNGGGKLLQRKRLWRYGGWDQRPWRILCVVKFTPYFTLRMRDRPEVRVEWCRRVLDAPERVQQQLDGKYEIWGYIAEVDKYLRVITLEDRETLDNAFFDRSYRRNR